MEQSTIKYAGSLRNKRYDFWFRLRYENIIGPDVLYDREYPEYEESLGAAIGDFPDFLTSFPVPVHIFDPFAPLTFIRSLREKGLVAGGVALTLTERRSQGQVADDKQNNLKLIVGKDFFKHADWKMQTANYLRKNAINGFQLITCLPGAAWRFYAPDHGYFRIPLSLHWLTVNRLWQYLDPDNGVLLVDFHFTESDNSVLLSKRVMQEQLALWETKMNERGMSAQLFDRQILRLNRTATDPKVLPIIPQIEEEAGNYWRGI